MAMKKAATILLAASLVASLSACGGKSDSGESASPEASQVPSSSTAPSASEAPTEQTAALEPEPGATLKIWEDKPQQTFVEARIKDFQEKYGVTVTFEELPPTDQVTKLTTDGPAGLGADVVVFPHDKVGGAVQAGLILPNDVFADEVTAANSENAVKAVTFEDVLYGYPYSIETYALFYNKKLFPTPPTTFEEIVNFAKTYNDPKNNKYTLMWELQQFYYDFGFMATTGGYIFGDDNTNKEDIGLNNEGAVEGVKFMKSLKDTVLPVKTGDVSGDIKNGLFADGTLALDINGPWRISEFKEAGVDFGVAPLPSFNGKPMKSFSGVKGYYVNAFTKYPNASKLLAEFLSNKDSQMKNFEMNGTLPANKEVASDPKVTGDPTNQAFLKQFDNSIPMPSLPEMNSIWGPITSAISDIWDGGKDIKTSLDTAVQQIKDSIKSSK
ncbi:sugar ABC transporter substrate-binding protein [Gorillibacterium timonense]|uniref:sugar ABC transporter substrate-binding protein n=1 Tax=Gorillibacterium timonense TaxID=1689269 RepID=UPI000A516FA0|nr:maltose ABC transporter substrate-binding protein [Gorillibacterium timonense]